MIVTLPYNISMGGGRAESFLRQGLALQSEQASSLILLLSLLSA